MSTISLSSLAFDQVKIFVKGKERTLPEFTSKGTQSYENGVWGYCRTFRFGKVLGFCGGHTVKMSIQRNGKTVAGLKIEDGKMKFFSNGLFRQGAPSMRYFNQAMEKLTPQQEMWQSNKLREEVHYYLSFFCAHLLPVWDQPKEGPHSYGIESSTYMLRSMPTWNKILFPLLNFNTYTKSTSPSYKLVRGQTSVKALTKAVFGVAGKEWTKYMLDILAHGNGQNKLEVILQLIKAGATKELAYEKSKTSIVEISQYLSVLLEAAGLNKTLKLFDEGAEHWYGMDTARMLESFKGLKIGKEIKSLRHLHDVLAWMSNHVQDADAPLWVHPEFKAYEGVNLDGYTVRFPEKRSDLKYWGAHLNICVGGYDTMVHKGQSIVFTLYKEDKPCICVEIKGDTHKLNQVMGTRNSVQPQPLWDAIEALMLKEPKKPMIDHNRKLQYDPKEDEPLDVLYKNALAALRRDEREGRDPFDGLLF
jgi:hypothetical protein